MNGFFLAKNCLLMFYSSNVLLCNNVCSADVVAAHSMLKIVQKLYCIDHEFYYFRHFVKYYFRVPSLACSAILFLIKKISFLF